MLEKYRSKVVTADKAAEAIKSGDWVDFGWTTTTPQKMDEAIAKRLPELYNRNRRKRHQ